MTVLSTALLATTDAFNLTADVTAPQSRLLRKSEPKTNEERVFEGLTSTKLQKYNLPWSKLQLGDDLSAVLKSPDVAKIAKFNLNRAPGSQVSMIQRITAKYGDDVVARTLVSIERDASDNPILLTMVWQLREDQIANWLKNSETVPGVVSKLKLGTDESIFRSRALDVLEDFIKKYNTARNGDESLLKTLTTIYGDESELVKMIAKTSVFGRPPYSNHPASIEKANNIESQLIQKWKSQSLPDFRVVNKLNFDDDVSMALSAGKVGVLIKYSDSKTSAFRRLSAKYGEADVAIAFAKAEGFLPEATALYRMQMNGWLSKGDTAGRVFSILKMKETRDFVYKLDALETYVKFLKTKNPDDVTDVFKVLKKGFGADEDKLALAIVRPPDFEITGYHKSLFQDWVARDLDPLSVAVKVFKMSEADVAAAKYSDELKPILVQYTKFFKETTDLPEMPAVRVGRS